MRGVGVKTMECVPNLFTKCNGLLFCAFRTKCRLLAVTFDWDDATALLCEPKNWQEVDYRGQRHGRSETDERRQKKLLNLTAAAAR